MMSRQATVPGWLIIVSFAAAIGLLSAAPLRAQVSMLCIDDVRTVDEPSLALLPPLPTSDPQSRLTLEDDRYLVEVSRSTGAITRIRDKKGGIELIREPRLADNFRFTLPIPGKDRWDTIEANYVKGKEQKLASFEVAPKRLTLRWDKPMTNYLGEKFDVAATMRIELTDEGIRLGLTIDNATPYTIGEVFFPTIGGIQGLGRTGSQLKTTQLVRPAAAGTVARSDIFRVFTNASPFGDQGPEQFFAYGKGENSWMGLFSPNGNRFVRFCAAPWPDRGLVLHLELLPGNSATVREDGNWPRPSELDGEPVGVSVSFVDFPNAAPGKTYKAVDVLISANAGDWHANPNVLLTLRVRPK
jgi:hypothetical protein